MIEKVADSTPMADPRGIPGPTDTRIGDVAYFVLSRISNLDFIELLPAYVQKEYQTEGVFAYHRYVAKRENRLQLQANLRDWYKKRRPSTRPDSENAPTRHPSSVSEN
ncbi:MAG: hypothetical protein IPJ30_16015 [Acidobacteria bacterium]|nr:hypothetical protein [Acidobacteriota bacterium]MBK8151066.1 hypothetical protein [Acidobacteriota bacterium]